MGIDDASAARHPSVRTAARHRARRRRCRASAPAPSSGCWRCSPCGMAAPCSAPGWRGPSGPRAATAGRSRTCATIWCTCARRSARRAAGSSRRRGTTLRLDLAGAAVDVLQFDAAIAAGDDESLRRAVELYTGPLLEGCVEEWAFSERAARAEQCLAALETLAERAAGAGRSRRGDPVSAPGRGARPAARFAAAAADGQSRARPAIPRRRSRPIATSACACRRSWPPRRMRRPPASSTRSGLRRAAPAAGRDGGSTREPAPDPTTARLGRPAPTVGPHLVAPALRCRARSPP